MINSDWVINDDAVCEQQGGESEDSIAYHAR